MASQNIVSDDIVRNSNTIKRRNYNGINIDYTSDLELLTRFIKEHEIITSIENDDNDDSDDDDDNINNNNTMRMIIPNNDGHRYVRRNCYIPHLQRIKNRQFYSADELEDITNSSTGQQTNTTTGNSSSSSNSTSLANSRTFVIEFPLDELCTWDDNNVAGTASTSSGKGKVLADRINENCMRYHDIFCDAIDTIIEALPTSETVEGTTGSLIQRRRRQQNASTTTDNNNDDEPNLVRDAIDILHQQRIDVMERNRTNQANATNNIDGGDVTNVYARNNGGIEMDQGAVDESAANRTNAGSMNATEDFPPILMRRYELRILPYKRKGSLPPFVNQREHHNNSNKSISTNKTQSSTVVAPISLRQIRSSAVGTLMSVTGMIVRCSDVKPSCQVATYSCDSCGAEIYQVLPIYNKEFMPARACPSGPCSQQPVRRRMQSLHLQTRGSRLIKFQELKMQELPNHVPMGHTPRSITVYCRGELTRLATPGDIVTIDGCYLIQRIAESGYRAMTAGLVSTTYLEAQNIIVHKKSYDDTSGDTDPLSSSTTSTITSEEERAQLDQQILDVATGDDPIGRLASSVAPEIFGHEDIKRSLLLQLVGGCTRTLPDGMRIRGDINILLMGDPGVAKSQLLKHVSSIAPRGVYTTGKGSSGVGLTAAVTKDMATGDLALEGGALVLADRGICCIDEFDKMDENDRTAIHEVMEQQTVSIAKAGIIASLNARASVLAAANPLYGRYNRYKSLSENINLPNSLLSRFDLLFLILDNPQIDKDIALARHVTFVHQNEGPKDSNTVDTKDTSNNNNNNADDDESDNDNDNNDTQKNTRMISSLKPVPPRILREYVARAKKYQPIISPDVAPYIVEAYVTLRTEQQESSKKRGGGSGYRNNNSTNNGMNKISAPANDQTVMTARQLLSILRLSQALARLRFSDYVAREDVDEAIRLTYMSKSSLLDTDQNNGSSGGGGNGGDGDGIDEYRKGKRSSQDVMSRIYNTLNEYAITIGATANNNNSAASSSNNNNGNDNNAIGIDISICQAMITRKGFTQQQLDDCINEYTALGIIAVNSTRTQLFFVQ